MPVRTESILGLIKMDSNRQIFVVIKGGQFYGTFPGTFCNGGFKSWFALDRMFDQLS